MVVNIIIPHLDHVMEMIEKSIFRPLPIIKKTNAPGEMGMEEEEVIIDPSWPHLQVTKDLNRLNFLANLRIFLVANRK
jgi:serine/threonine-protein phosphatase 2A regulatory subunit B'